MTCDVKVSRKILVLTALGIAIVILTGTFLTQYPTKKNDPADEVRKSTGNEILRNCSHEIGLCPAMIIQDGNVPTEAERSVEIIVAAVFPGE